MIIRIIGSLARTFCKLVLGATLAIVLPAQVLTPVYTFQGLEGAVPTAPLVQGADGNFYGTTNGGGSGGGGTVFKLTPSGTQTTIYNFCSQAGCTDGYWPYGALVQDLNGDFYGTTERGGANDGGLIFKVTKGRALSILYNFCSQNGTSACADGASPIGGLSIDSNGELYGTTELGGTSGNGTVFKITPTGVLTSLYSFCSQAGCADGANPLAGLAQATNGDFYGATFGFGETAPVGGTIFTITPRGVLTTLYTFCTSPCSGSSGPEGTLVVAANGDLYGTTFQGGASGNGTVFKLNKTGTLDTLYSFCSQSGCTDGATPIAGLFRATDGSFYGTTLYGGASGYGTVFKIAASGDLTTIHSFCSEPGCTDGATPWAGLMQDTNGDLYGTTERGGNSGGPINGDGIVFRLAVGLGPFVETRPTGGSVGEAIRVLGTHLAGATGVTFNDIPAVFTVVSPSEIAAKVPVGASSGEVQVVTPGGTFKSNSRFRVIP